MKLIDVDYYALYGNSWLHKIPAGKKLLTAIFILLFVIASKDFRIISIIYSVLLVMILLSGLPKLRVIALSLYPLIFTSILILSIEDMSISFMLLLIFKVITSSALFVTIIFTTSFTDIFRAIEKYLPSFLVSVLFITYRSIFILWNTLENLQLAMYIRGKPNIKKPIYSIKVLSNALGFLVITAIESSENMHQGMRIRGFSDNLKYLRK